MSGRHGHTEVVPSGNQRACTSEDDPPHVRQLLAVPTQVLDAAGRRLIDESHRPFNRRWPHPQTDGPDDTAISSLPSVGMVGCAGHGRERHMSTPPLGFATVTDEAALQQLAGIPGVTVTTVDTLRQHRLIEAMMPSGVPGVADVDQARRNTAERHQFLTDHGAYTAVQVHKIAGSSASNPRALASDWASQRRIFAVDHDGQRLYPAFQFGDDGQPLPHVRDVLLRLPKALTGWSLALWWTTPNDRLDGDRPVDRVVEPRDTLTLAIAAESEAGDWQFDTGVERVDQDQ